MLISVLMFYFFLAGFFWMLCEAIFVWRALITIFTENDRLGYYLLFGWGKIPYELFYTIKEQKTLSNFIDSCNNFLYSSYCSTRLFRLCQVIIIAHNTLFIAQKTMECLFPQKCKNIAYLNLKFLC